MQATLYRDQPSLSYLPSNIQAAVACLVSTVRLPTKVINLWAAGSEGLAVALCVNGVTLDHKPVPDLAPLYPTFYADSPPDSVFVGCPSGHVLDLVLFLAVLHAPVLVAVLVPAAYLSHAPPARTAALGRLARADRLCTLPCPPCGEARLVKSEWILVFKDAATRAATLLPHAVVTILPPST